MKRGYQDWVEWLERDHMMSGSMHTLLSWRPADGGYTPPIGFIWSRPHPVDLPRAMKPRIRVPCGSSKA